MIDWIEGLLSAFDGLGSIGYVLFACAYVAAGVVLIPEWIFTVAAGVLFGMGWGFAISWGCAMAAAMLATAIAIAPGTLMAAFLGATGRALLGGGGVIRWSLFAAGIAASVVLSVFLGRLAKRRLGIER